MKNKIAKFTLIAVAVLLMLVPLSMGFGISGAVFKENVSPGQKVVHKIIVVNNENVSLQNMTAGIYGLAKDLNGTNIEILSKDDTGTFTARPFLSIEPKRFDLKPYEEKVLLLTGTVPENIGPGGKYALIAIKTTPKTGRGISVSAAIQSVVMLTINNTTLIQTGEITDLKSLNNNNSVRVDLTFKNTGNIHYKPLAEAVLEDKNGNILAKGEVKQDKSSTILPMNSYLFKINLEPETSLVPGTYTVEAKVIKDDGTVLDSKETILTV